MSWERLFRLTIHPLDSTFVNYYGIFYKNILLVPANLQALIFKVTVQHVGVLVTLMGNALIANCEFPNPF